MKLLFDQNISFRILQRIQPFFPDATQVILKQLQNATDRQIWEYAKQHGYMIVTFDSDFYDFSIIWGSPPKIILIRSFNQTTHYIAELLIKHKDNIVAFSQNSSLDCLEIR
jgi:predicted nuclease of predicted toxin-antitoxin system